MIDRQYINELKNDVNVKKIEDLTDYEKMMIAVDLFERKQKISQLSALEPASSSFDIISAIPRYARADVNDNAKVDLAMKIADSIVSNIVNYYAEDIEEYFL